MKKIQNLFLAALILGIAACSKNDNTNPPDNNVPLPSYPVIKYIINDNGDTTKYTYDSTWSVKTENGGSYENINFYTNAIGYPSENSYTYAVASVYNNGSPLDINNQGLRGRYGSGPFVTQCSYNSDSTLSSDITNGNMPRNYSYSNGNLVSVQGTIPNGTGGTVSKNATLTYTNYQNTIGNKNIGKRFLNKSSINALESIHEIQTNNSTGGIIERNTTFSYTLNNSGSIASVQITRDGTTQTYRFFYY